MTLPRARYQCPHCKRYYRVTMLGDLRRHKLPGHDLACFGSYTRADPERMHPEDQR